MDKKKKNVTLLTTLICLGIGGVCGLFSLYYKERIFEGDSTLLQGVFVISLTVIFIYIASFFQIVIHETGHLVFGLITGYSFASFRVANLMWLKDGNKIRFKRYSLVGMVGQCLMYPPESIDGKFPTVLYNLGGSLMNFIVSIPFLIVSIVLLNIPLLSLFLLIMAIIGISFALMNGLPVKMSPVNNDGCNAKDLRKDKDALGALCIQMKIYEQTTKGVRVKDMPSEWFELPSEAKMDNAIIASIAVLTANRLVDEQNFDEAKTLIEKLLNCESILGLHRGLLICDRICLELFGSTNIETISALFNAEQKKFMVQMKSFISVVRTEYAYAKIIEKDDAKAEKLKLKFEKIASSYPFKSEVEGERELMKLADIKYSNMYSTINK